MDEDDWLKKFSTHPNPSLQPLLTNVIKSPLNPPLITIHQPPALVAPFTTRGTVEDLATGIRRMSLDRNPTYFGVGEEVTGGASSSSPNVLPTDLAHALHQMAAGVTSLAHAVGGGTAQSTRGTVLTGDPQFPMWDGQPASLLGWIAETTRMKEIRNLPDELAIRYARLRLEPKLQEVYPTVNQPETWEQFTTFLKNTFFHANWSLILRLILQGQKMNGNDFNQYLSMFRRMCREIPELDDRTAQAAFVQGLNPYLRYEVLRDWQDGQGKTEEMIRKAWAAHSGLALPWLESVGRMQTPLGPTPMELDAFRTSETPNWNVATLAPNKPGMSVAPTMQNPFNVPSREPQGRPQRPLRGRDQRGRFPRPSSRSKSPNQNSPTRIVRCEYCGKSGHLLQECWSNPQNAGQRSPAFRPPTRMSSPGRNMQLVQCFKCKQMGHYATRCPGGSRNSPSRPNAPSKQNEYLVPEKGKS